jgi:hypothetical protein
MEKCAGIENISPDMTSTSKRKSTSYQENSVEATCSRRIRTEQTDCLQILMNYLFTGKYELSIMAPTPSNFFSFVFFVSPKHYNISISNFADH